MNKKSSSTMMPVLECLVFRPECVIDLNLYCFFFFMDLDMVIQIQIIFGIVS